MVDLQKEYEQMAYVIKALGGGIWEFDVTSGRLECNQRWHEIMGLDYETQRIHSIEQFKPHIHPDDVERATKVDMEELNRLITLDESYCIEFRIVQKNKQERWIRSVASLIVETDKNIRAIGCVTDITSLINQMLQPGLIAPHDNGLSLQTEQSLNQKKQQEQTSSAILSGNEIECLRWVSMGKTAKETAVILNKSPRTIEFHLSNAVKKMNAVNRIQAVCLAIEQNLL